MCGPTSSLPPHESLGSGSGTRRGILTTTMDPIDRALLESAPHLKVVSQMAVGVDNIDVAEATRRGILVGHTPGVLSSATADLAFSLLMAAARRVTEVERFVRAGNWKLAFHPKHWLGADVGGATIGIVGLGSIGLEVAKRAKGFDMRVLYHSRTRKEAEEGRYYMEYADFSTLLRDSDFVTLHVPLTPDTRPLHRREGAGRYEAHRHTHQHVTWAGGGPRGAVQGPQGGLDSRSGPGRHRARAHTRGRPSSWTG